jgi:phosphate uptake regulator
LRAWARAASASEDAISSCLDYLFVAKSFERIGDHATNIFEHVIYAVHGETCATPRLSPRSSHNGAGGAISLSQPGLTLA